MVFPEAFFGFDQDNLDTVGRSRCEALGQMMLKEMSAASTFELVGHADEAGSETYNQALSERRAAAVRNHLVQVMHVSPSRIRTRGVGESRPAAPGLTGSQPGAHVNRNVETILLKES